MEEIGMDPSAANPGPIDPSVLYDQDKHVSSAVWDGQVHFSFTPIFSLYLFANM